MAATSPWCAVIALLAVLVLAQADEGRGAAAVPEPVTKTTVSVSARVEGDVWGRMGIAPSLQAAVRYGWFSAAFTGVVVPIFGLRAEARFLPLRRGLLNPWLGGGTTFFLKPGVEALFYLRAALGLILAIGQHLEFTADAAAEYLPGGASSYSDVALVLSGGVGWHF
ncbi:MAG: hypothetical protein QM817_21300 [Archangium sp.]